MDLGSEVPGRPVLIEVEERDVGEAFASRSSDQPPVGLNLDVEAEVQVVKEPVGDVRAFVSGDGAELHGNASRGNSVRSAARPRPP